MAREIERLKTLAQYGNSRIRGSRTLIVSESSVEAEMAALWNQPWPGFSGSSYIPYCVHTRAAYRPNGIVGVAIIQAYYDSGGFRQARQPGKARLYTETSAYTENVKREPEGEERVIEGADAASPGVFWQVVEGSNHGFRYRTKLMLETAYSTSQFNLGNIFALENHVNSSSLNLLGFGTVGAETLKCLSIRSGQQSGADIVDITYLFHWSGPGKTWNNSVKSQEGAWVLQKVPRFNAGGVFVDLNESAYVWTLGKKPVQNGEDWTLADAEPEDRRPFETTNFSTYLQGLSSW